MEATILYALCIYFVFHVLSRSEILKVPRDWALKHLPAKLTYPLSCAFCFTWWVGVGLTAVIWLTTGILLFSATHLAAAPVMNLLLDLVIRVLIRKNEPPVLSTSLVETYTMGDKSVTKATTTSPVFHYHPSYGGVATFGTSQDSVRPSITITDTNPFNPLAHEQTK